MKRRHKGKKQLKFMHWSTEVAVKTKTPDFEHRLQVEQYSKCKLHIRQSENIIGLSKI